jgi:malate dehydrogenase (oxaloacetate-decarboxylating)(NADP+)
MARRIVAKHGVPGMIHLCRATLRRAGKAFRRQTLHAKEPSMASTLETAAIEYHEQPTPGKISVIPTKGLTNQRDLALAYSPGVAYACKAIEADPARAAKLTSRGNLVGVVTNGTAVLGLGNIGPLAGKPVMEGKGCLFKKFAGIDVFDIELAETNPDKLVDIIAALEPTLGGINLEDIKAPECFYIESRLRERMKIPVFHDDQHGTAIIVGAAVINGLKVVGKQIGEVKLVCSGAGASAIACLDLLVRLGLKRENVTVCDTKGVIFEGRDRNMEPNKARYARRTDARTLADAIPGADIFLGLSGPGAMKQEWVITMAPKPLVLALANPTPEILPEDVKAVRPDAVIATGRSDYPNQVNNVLCFPFIFRGALDVGATKITDEMKLACVHAIAELAQAEQSDVVALAYEGEELSFGPEYIIPKPFDPRLIVRIAPAVAKAAMDSGVATRPITDFDSYREQLTAFVYHSGFVMKPVFSSAKKAPRRVVYAEGEDERVLRAVQVVVDEKIAKPILIGRPEVVDTRLKRFGLRIRRGKDFELVNPESDPRYREVWTEYYQIMRRKGVSPDDARVHIRQSTTLIGAMLLRRGDADALLCGTFGRHKDHLRHVNNVIGLRKGATTYAAMNLLLLPKRTLFITDTYVNEDPNPQQLAEITLMAADEVRRFGVQPRIALLSHSNFGTDDSPSALKMGQALDLITRQAPDLEIDGEMHGDAALSEAIRDHVNPDSRLRGEANLVIMPNLDAANIAFNLLKITGGEGVTVGPILLGAAAPVHILTPTATVRRLVNMTALCSVDANAQQKSLF